MRKGHVIYSLTFLFLNHSGGGDYLKDIFFNEHMPILASYLLDIILWIGFV